MIHDFHVNDDTGSKQTGHLTTRNSELASNAVYAFAKSRRNLLWIGSDGPGLNYYSYREKRIRRLPSKSRESIVYVHSICEVSDSVLWLATVGSGILKVVIAGTADEPVIESVERTMFTRDEVSYNYFFSACRENDSVLWFGNRGYGMQRLSLQTESFRQVVFRNRDIKTINDILSLHRDKKGDMWLGSSFGITKLLQYDNDSVVYENYNEIEGLPNNTIHGILEDDLGHLWLSTNNGIVQFDPATKNFRIYNHRNGLDVIEFSDGAYFKCEETGILFFGGTNGFLTVAQDVFMEKKLAPPIRFTGLRIYENEYNLADFMRKKNNKEYLELKYAQNFFSVSFSALDYINGQNSRYSYILENFNNQWIEKRIFNVVTFTKVPPGEYTLRVKYDNGSSGGQNNDIYSLRIVILPPWYLSVWACLLYLAGVVSVVFFCYFWFRKYYRNKREIMIEKLNRQQKEAIYESKLRFFTNLTHELSTPLTLIYGPCSRIVSHPGTDAYVKKYATLILKNAERLNALIQELIEFRRIETGHKSCSIERLSISETAGNIADSFTDLAETRNIDYQINIKNGLYWNTDKGCFSKILTNLLSNAFKYTPDNGKIEVNIHLMDDALQALVSNTGKGFDEKDIPFIFDRYTVLANFENQKGMSSRNGLGLAICHNLAKLLHGEIHVRSIPGVLTEFRVTLPHQDVNVSEKREIREAENVLYHQFDSEKPVVETGDYQYIKSRATILVIDDDPEMLWFIAEIFKEHYNVIPLDNPSRVDEALLQTPPNLIISDIMMPQIDGITLLKQTKSDKRTHHIPFILLSAKNTPEEQVEGIEAGADIYLTKPFNVDYLRSVVDHLLQRQDDLKDYYHSAISSFEFMDGKYIHKEDKIFMENAIRIIDKNIQDPAFSPQQLATQMGMSIRHLYRKLKTTTDYTPADLIREYKLAIAEGLLVTSQLSIDEIMYKAGFSNRGSFYKAFLQKFGLTPKNYRIQKKEAT
jgi:signal transduction histidine kinase/AraC-like DNA-binding protein